MQRREVERNMTVNTGAWSRGTTICTLAVTTHELKAIMVLSSGGSQSGLSFKVIIPAGVWRRTCRGQG